MPSRTLDYPVFDADNHMYEPREAFTKFLPKEFEGLIDYVDVKGRTKIVVKGNISNYIPNPTFDVVAAPGAQEDYFRNGNPDGLSYRELMGDPIRCWPAFREPAPRLELMDEQGVDRTLMFPTLASLLEVRLGDDPVTTHAVIHSLNQWMHETWTFNYQDRIFATPIINFSIVDQALAEVDYVLERGAKCVLVRPGPTAGFGGTRSPALPEYDAVWKRLDDAGVLVGMHASDSGYAQIANWWEGDAEFQPFKPNPFRAMTQGKRPICDTMASLVCHGLLTRFPNLKIAAVENGANWVKGFLYDLNDVYKKMPQAFDEHPCDAFKRNIYVNPFWEDGMQGLIDILGADHILFGSDFPHPEGLADPISYVDELEGIAQEDVVKIMGGNLADLMHVGATV